MSSRARNSLVVVGVSVNAFLRAWFGGWCWSGSPGFVGAPLAAYRRPRTLGQRRRLGFGGRRLLIFAVEFRRSTRRRIRASLKLGRGIFLADERCGEPSHHACRPARLLRLFFLARCRRCGRRTLVTIRTTRLTTLFLLFAFVLSRFPRQHIDTHTRTHTQRARLT